ncbi:hypothetical protein [Archangium violaceum]|uniref:hypothetical protein n=1 Tax=Archangium violaceum TaxID=83451 RepID=UPI001EEF8FCF|nr:hypothetical protein [Archangium violaceum]
MRIESMRPTARWWYALEPTSWPKVFVPALFGQAVGAATAGRLSMGASELHRAIWWGTFTLSALVLAVGLGGRK